MSTPSANADRQDSDTTRSIEPPRPSVPVSIPFSVFVQWERWSIIAMVALATLFSPLSANIYLPAIPSLSREFHRSIESINLTVTVYMIMQGIAPSVWGSIADRKGRRPSFILCLLILLLSCVGLALVPTSDYWLLVLLRCIQAAGSASTVALSAGVVADIIPTEKRGGYTGIVNAGAMIGPCMGPVIGGLLSGNLGWRKVREVLRPADRIVTELLTCINRSIFWFLVIASGVCMVFMILLFPETLRSQVGNGSIPVPRWNRALMPIIGRSSLDMQTERPPPRPLPNPFKLFTAPDLMILLFGTAVIYSSFYAVTATISSLFADNFPHLTETEIGLCYLSIGGGGVLATISAGKLLDWQYQSVKRKFEASLKKDSEKNRDTTESPEVLSSLSAHDDFPIEKACLQTQQVWYLLFSVCIIGYGWALEAKTSIAVPLVLQFFLGFSMTAAMTNVQTLSVDLFPTQGSSVTAANNFVRCLMGAAFVSVITIITNAIGPGWTYTLCGGLCFLMWPLLLLELKIGPTWRRRREERNRRAQEASL